MNHRNVQIAHELMRALGRIISEELSQEKYGLVTITDCVVTLGLDEAKVYISALKQAVNARNELNRRKKHLIERLKREVRIRKIPKITFIHDTRPDMVEQLEAVMSKDNH